MPVHQEISNSDDVIDSRDVIARIEELEDMVHDESATEEDLEDLAALKALAKEGEDYSPDWEYGATLIRHSYFTDYCIEMVQDIGDLPRDIPGYLAIDWEKTADNLKVDYTEIDFDGVAYFAIACARSSY